MRASRAGRTGRTWYGAYDLRYADPSAAGGVRYSSGHTNKTLAIRHARRMVENGEAAWAEVLTDRTSEGGGQLIARFPKKTGSQLDADIAEAIGEESR